MPEDTLWFIIEEDYRWFPEGSDPQGADQFAARAEATKRKRDQVAVSLPPHNLRGSITCEPTVSNKNKIGHRESTTSMKGKGKKAERPESRYFQALPKGSSVMADQDEGCCENVADMVRMAKFAKCKKMGNIIWASWQPRGKNRAAGARARQCWGLGRPA